MASIRAFVLTLLFVAGGAEASSVSLRLLPPGLSVGQAAEWIVDATCYRVVANPAYAAESAHLLATPVDYSRLQYRDHVSIDSALVLIAPPDSLVIIDNDQALITYRSRRDSE